MLYFLIQKNPKKTSSSVDCIARARRLLTPINYWLRLTQGYCNPINPSKIGKFGGKVKKIDITLQLIWLGHFSKAVFTKSYFGLFGPQKNEMPS